MTYPSGTPDIPLDELRDRMLIEFESKTKHLHRNSEYYDSEARPQAIGMAVPPEMQKLLAHVGYPRLYIDSVSERLAVQGFQLGNADEADDDLWDWWQANNLDVEAPLGHTDALIHGRAYITISAPDPEYDLHADPAVPIIKIEPPTCMWADIDPRTNLVTRAIRVVRSEAVFSPHEIIAVTLFLPDQTVAWTRQNAGGWQVVQESNHDLGVVPVVPILNRTRLSDRHGSSLITPEIRAVTDAAARILMDMQGAAELMAIPQRLLFGVNPNDIGVDPETGESRYDAYMAKILAFADPEGKAFQFAAAELSNFGAALDQLDRKAASYTGLPPQYLAVTSDNPASAEAIQASESRLVKHAERKALIFGGAWECAMRIAYMVMNGGVKSLPSDYLRMESIWADPSTPTYAAKADAATKLYAGGLGVIPKERARIDMGYSVVEREQMGVWDKEEMAGLLGAYAVGPGAVVPAPISAPTTPAGPGAPGAPAAKPAAKPAPAKAS